MSSGFRICSTAWLRNQEIWSSGKSAKIGILRNSEAATILVLHLAQVLMNELHRDRAFSHSRSHSLHRAMTNVTHGKDAGNVGLKQEGISLQSPALRPRALPQKIGPRENEPKVVPLDPD